ncbi:MAG: TGS domain-containing protein, partial [Proteobacteria bacterium]|nr:TGS domain-containing protein [Pseudomonadota bacterium]
VDSLKDCYEALGIVHAMWKPMPGRFKDYIAMPKANMYQSLHTTVIRPSGDPCEIQIRTREMHDVCEFGVAAHWSYKENSGNTNVSSTNPDISKMAWLRQIVEWQKEIKDPDEFLEAVKVDLFDEEIFVFTPKGDVFQLPLHATALDFAFAVHSAIGQSTVGAKVNGRMVPIKKELKSGDIVEILTSPKQRPNKDWLTFVNTSKAKNRIRSFLRIDQRERSKVLGKDLLIQELNLRGIEFENLEKTSQLQAIVKSSKEASIEDVFVGVGYGKISAKELLDRVYPSRVLKTLAEVELEPDSKSISISNLKRTGKGRGILVSGLDNLLVSMARCCSPLPGEDIVGFVTRGKGVTIHKYDCPRARDMDPARKVDVTWGAAGENDTKDDYSTSLKVVTHDKPGILADVTLAISSFGANIKKAQVQVGKDRLGYLDFDIMIKSASQLLNIIAKLESLPSVMRVERKVAGYETKKRKKTNAKIK